MLLQEQDLTFDKALEIAVAAEAAEKDSKRLSYDSSKSQDNDTSQYSVVHKIDKYRSTKLTHQAQLTDCVCYRCGGKHNYDCHYYKEKGHPAKVWQKKSRGQNKPEQANVVNTIEEDPEYTMYHIGLGSSNSLQTTVKVNGKPLIMEIDTGESVSVVSEQTFKSLQESQSELKLEQSSVRLQAYSGQPIAVVGSTQVVVTHNNQTLILPLIVTQGDGPSLLG